MPLNSARDTARLRLDELNRLIDALVAERQQVQTELDSIIYSVLDVPTEITAHIFTFSLPKGSAPSRLDSPLLLTQICHSWREIAVATPSLWQSIHINEGQASHRLGSGQLLEMWLHRSASLPLSLSFARSDAGAQSLIDASLNHHRRWRELELSSKASSHGAVVIDGTDKDFPLLRKVTLKSWDDVSWGGVIIQNAPILHEASVAIGAGTSGARLPWAQLIRLCLFTHNSAAECLPILSQCSDLLLRLAQDTFLPRPATDLYNQPHLTLNSLQSLEVNSTALVPHLTLPCLRRLTLSDGYVPGDIGPFQALFSRSNCSLLQLTVLVADHKFRPLTLLPLFQLVPTITHLRLNFKFAAVHQVMASLSLPSTLPSLATLTILAYRVRDDYDELLDVLRSRRANDTLQSFSLTLLPYKGAMSPEETTGPLPQTALGHFQDLANAGLKCRIVFKINPRPLVFLDTFDR
ncbi:hypothetical protein DFH06DRAFT_1472688 [Mycena polygramma]|nr:hypothetical protein DFH06DRAFT_1472688 [Mycena polygramma]